MNGTLEVYRSRSLRRSQRWRWRLVHRNGRVIAESGEGYANRPEAERMGLAVVNGEHAKPTVIRRPAR